MTPRIEELLTRARLTTTAYSQSDIDAAETRLAARFRAGTRQNTTGDPQEPAECAQPYAPAEGDATRDLRILCEAVAGHTGALEELELDAEREEFATGVMPAPAGARVLGCLLYLAQEREAAQFWWQFAAGAEDLAAAYCLFLHHLALGEDSAANFWLAQAAAPGPEEGTVAAALRILRLLKKDHLTTSDPVTAVLAYMPVALTYVDEDLDLPLPQPDFSDRIRRLAANRAHSLGLGAPAPHTALTQRTFPRPKLTEPGDVHLEPKYPQPDDDVPLPAPDLIHFNILRSALLGTRN